MNSEGKPVNSISGYCITKWDFDKDRNLIKVAYFDNTDKPAINNSVGYAVVRYEYDEIRNRIGEYYFDEEGKPVKAKNGVMFMRTSFDKNREVLGRFKR